MRVRVSIHTWTRIWRFNTCRWPDDQTEVQTWTGGIWGSPGPGPGQSGEDLLVSRLRTPSCRLSGLAGGVLLSILWQMIQLLFRRKHLSTDCFFVTLMNDIKPPSWSCTLSEYYMYRLQIKVILNPLLSDQPRHKNAVTPTFILNEDIDHITKHIIISYNNKTYNNII